MANKRFIVRHGLDNSGDNSVANTITNVAEPVNNSDAATKYYVDSAVGNGLPSQSGNEGKFLTTNGTTASWSLVPVGGISATGTPSSTTYLRGDGTWATVTSGSGDVVGPASATDNAVVRFDGTTGKLIQNSTVTLSDTGILTVPELSTTSITSTGNNPIVIAPDGTGDVHLNADSVRIGDSNADATIATRGTGDLLLTTNEGSATEGIIRIYDGANGNITLTPNGTGQVQVGTDQVVTLAASQTLTNKSISGSTNTFSNIPNSATTATSANTASAIVARDASGNFSAGTITATLSGNATNVTGTVAVANGGTGLTTLTAGYIPYGNGTSAFGSSANLFWDSANSRLGVGTTSPSEKINVSGGNILVSNSGSCATKYGNGSLTHEFGILSSSYGGYGVFTANSAYVYANSSNVQLGADGGYIAFGTGSGSLERMRIDSSGNVGIGTASPSAKLESVSTTSGAGGWYIAAQLSAANYPALRFAATTPNKYSSIGNNGDGSLYFMVNGTSSSIGTEAAVITASGNVGIGTSSPATGARLHVLTSSSGNTLPNNAPLIIEQTGNTVLAISGSSASEAGLFMPRGTSAYYTGIYRNDTALLFRNNDAERMRIDSSGNVGIGTSSPATKLNISGTLRFTPNTADTNYSADIKGNYDSAHPFQIDVKNNGSSAEYIGVYADGGGSNNRVVFPTGNVGIGTSSPSEKLTVAGKIKIYEGSSGGYGWIYGSDTNHSIIMRGNRDSTAGDYTNYYQYGSSSGGHHFWTGGVLASQTEKFRITNDYSSFLINNVGIGTSSPSTKLHVANGGSNAQATFVGTTGSPYITVVANSGTTILGNESNGGWVGTTGSQAFVFKTNDTERMRITSGGNLLIGATSQAYATSGYMLGVQSGGAQTFISIAKSGQTLDSGGMIIGLDAGGGYVWNRENINLYFGTNNTERMRITSGGDVAIGNTSPSEKLHVTGNIRASGVYVGNGSSGSYTKGFGGVQTTTSTSTPTGGSSGDFTLIY